MKTISAFNHGKTILVTGCAGLLGNHFSRFLLKKGYNVIGIDNMFGSYSDYLPEGKNFKFYKISLDKDFKELSDIYEKHKPEATYHFAAYASEGLSPFVRVFNYQNNVIASASVINNCVNHDSKLIFTSSMAVYGCSAPPFTEDLRPTPCDPYGIAKYTVEQDIENASKQFGLRYNIVRPHNVLGIYQNIWDKYRNVIGIFIRKSLKNEPLIIYGDGEQTRAFSDIKYYMDPLHLLLDDYNGEIFNVGADKHFSLNETATSVKKIAKSFMLDVKIEHGEAREEVKDAYCNHDKAKDLLKFNDKTNLLDLITEMFFWAKEQPDREVGFMDYEIEKDIYSYWK
jgi:UDP-glucose 4-epimerase